jgi:DNA-binding transcriptional LysR family regulator
MQLKALKRIDLNLLVALQVLLEESNVSRAADRLFITQPAMSKTLGRLRDVFNDPLFIRGPHGIRPTPRALELKTALGSVLEDIDTLIAPVVFDPSNFVGEVSIAVSEFIGIAIVPLLMKELQNEAPSLHIKTMSRIEHQLDHLADGDLDIAIHIQRDNYGNDFNTECVATGNPVFLCRENHPITQQEINLENVSEQSFVTFYIADREELAIFRQQAEGNERLPESFSRFETAHLLTALEVVRHTDMLMVATPYLVQNPVIADGIQCIPIPESEQTTAINYMLTTHKRTDRSQVIQWLKAKIVTICDQQMQS